MRKRMLWPLLFLLLTACAAPEVPEASAEPTPPVEIVEPAPPPQPEPEVEPEPEPELGPPEMDGPVRYLRMLEGEPQASASWPYLDRTWWGELEMPAAPFVEDGVFFFPLQFVAEAMGVDYARDGDAVTLRWEGHETVFYLNSRRFRVDGVEGQVEGTHFLYREGLPDAPADDRFTPIERDGVVFLPLDFLPPEFRANYNSFAVQARPQVDVTFYNNMDREAPAPDAARGITIFAYEDKALVNGQLTQMPAAPFPDNELLYVPLSFLAEATGTAYTRDGDQLLLTCDGHTLELTLGSALYSIDGEAGAARQSLYWSNHPAAPADFVPVERDGLVFVPTDFLPHDDRLPVCALGLQHLGYYGMAIYGANDSDETLAGYRLGLVYDELPRELRANMVSEGIVDEDVRGYDVEGYHGGGVHLRVYRRRPGWSNEEGMDGAICAIAVTDPAIPTDRGLRVGDSPRRAWELYGTLFADTFSFQYTPPAGPITLIGIHGLYYAGFDLPNHYIAGVPEAWLELPPAIEGPIENTE